MGRNVDRLFISFLYRNFKKEIRNHYNFCKCYFCKKFHNLHKELERWCFHNLNHNKWFIIFHQSDNTQITLFPVFI